MERYLKTLSVPHPPSERKSLNYRDPAALKKQSQFHVILKAPAQQNKSELFIPISSFSVSSGRPAESVDVHGVLLLSLLRRGQSLHRTAQVHKLQLIVKPWPFAPKRKYISNRMNKNQSGFCMFTISCCVSRVHEINSLLAPFDYTTQPSWQSPKYLGE